MKHYLVASIASFLFLLNGLTGVQAQSDFIQQLLCGDEKALQEFEGAPNIGMMRLFRELEAAFRKAKYDVVRLKIMKLAKKFKKPHQQFGLKLILLGLEEGKPLMHREAIKSLNHLLTVKNPSPRKKNRAQVKQIELEHKIISKLEMVLYTTKDPLVSIEAFSAIRKLGQGNKKIVAKVLESLNHPDNTMRAAAIGATEVLGLEAYSKSFPRLLDALYDDSPIVRKQAQQVLLSSTFRAMMSENERIKADYALVQNLITEKHHKALEIPHKEVEEVPSIGELKATIEDPVLTETVETEGTETLITDKNELKENPNKSELDSSKIGLGGGTEGGNSGAFGNRFGEKKELVKKEGGGIATEKAVQLALEWLKKKQNANGSWTSGENWTTPGQTGLALLAFLGAGNTHREGKYRDQVRGAIKYLRKIQDAEGCFGSREKGTHFMYNHVIATLAMCEIYGMSQSPLLKSTAQEGINFLVNSQNPGLAWRYEPQSGDNDSSVSGWAVMALKSAKVAGLKVPPETFDGARNWYDYVTDDSYYRAGYMKRGDPGARLAGLEGKYASSEAMTAVAITARTFMGENPHTSIYIKGGAKLLSRCLPKWDDGSHSGESKIDFYYWYYGTLATFQLGGSHWKNWNLSLKKALLKNQIITGEECGSWPSIGAWSKIGGPVYSTALNVLSLEIYYRYSRVTE